MRRHIRFRDFDWVLLLIVVLICSLGVLEIYSATLNTKFQGMHIRQVYWVAAGLLLMFILSMVNYQVLLENVPWMYVISIVSLLAVLVFGRKYLGARRWILMPGGSHFQPSEWVKLVLILAIAKYFADYNERELPFRELMKAGLIVVLPMLLVLKQPDLGTALTYVPVAMMGLFLGGMRAKHALILLLIAGVLMPVVWHYGLKPYQKERLTSFMAPDADRQGLRLPGKPVVGCGRLRRALGQGRNQGNPNPGTVPAGAPYRLYLCRLVGGARIHRRNLRLAVILFVVDAFDQQRSNGARSCWNVHRDGCCGGSCVSRAGECGNGGRLYACDRHPTAVDELWRFVGAVYLSGARYRDERPYAPFRELACLPKAKRLRDFGVGAQDLSPARLTQRSRSLPPFAGGALAGQGIRVGQD